MGYEADGFLEARGIHKSYHDGRKETVVLKGVDLRIGEGSFTALVGPSGAGKSTLLHILGGLDTPTRGAVSLEGSPLHGVPEAVLARVRNKRIGFVFQFYHLLSDFSVLENVMMPALISREPGTRRKDLRERALGLLERVGLRERAAYFPAQLSGGEKQRAAIARSLINSPSLLLCDEPTGNLDSSSGGEIAALIREFNTRNRMTVVLVTHNLELAKAADRVYRLRDGMLAD